MPLGKQHRRQQARQGTYALAYLGSAGSARMGWPPHPLCKRGAGALDHNSRLSLGHSLHSLGERELVEAALGQARSRAGAGADLEAQVPAVVDAHVDGDGDGAAGSEGHCAINAAGQVERGASALSSWLSGCTTCTRNAAQQAGRLQLPPPAGSPTAADSRKWSQLEQHQVPLLVGTLLPCWLLRARITTECHSGGTIAHHRH